MKEMMDLAGPLRKSAGSFRRTERSESVYKSVIQVLDKEDREFIEPLFYLWCRMRVPVTPAIRLRPACDLLFFPRPSDRAGL